MEWDDEQQALILALDLLRRQTCAECGGHLPETTDPANAEAYTVVGPFLCYSCEALGSTRDSFAKERESSPVHNMSRWSIRRKG